MTAHKNKSDNGDFIVSSHEKKSKNGKIMPLEPGEHRDYSSDEENSSPYLSSHNKNLKKIPMPLMHGSPEILEKVLHHPDDKQSSDEDMAHN